MSFDRFDQKDRDAVRELGQAELAQFVSRRREWIVESLPLAGLKLPNLEPPPRPPR
jgi:hypothetical protein